MLGVWLLSLLQSGQWDTEPTISSAPTPLRTQIRRNKLAVMISLLLYFIALNKNSDQFTISATVGYILLEIKSAIGKSIKYSRKVFQINCTSAENP